MRLRSQAWYTQSWNHAPSGTSKNASGTAASQWAVSTSDCVTGVVKSQASSAPSAYHPRNARPPYEGSAGSCAHEPYFTDCTPGSDDPPAASKDTVSVTRSHFAVSVNGPVTGVPKSQAWSAPSANQPRNACPTKVGSSGFETRSPRMAVRTKASWPLSGLNVTS